MEVSAATGMYQRRGDSPLHRELPEVLEAMTQVGFSCFDLSFSSVDQPNFLLRGDDWERKVAALGETAARLGAVFPQSHLPFVPGCSAARWEAFRSETYREQFLEYIRRGYHASRMLNIPWAVIHPLTCPEHNYERKATFEENHRFYDRFVELGIRLGVGTAIENMPASVNRKLGQVYCQHYDELMELVDSFESPLVGICWDTGHAHVSGLNQQRSLEVMGSRVKVLHIHDNHTGAGDEHLLPYMGDVDWDSVLRGLAHIGYTGTLNYESGNTSARAFGRLQLEYMKMTLANGRYLADRYEEIRKREAGTVVLSGQM